MRGSAPSAPTRVEKGKDKCASLLVTGNRPPGDHLTSGFVSTFGFCDVSAFSPVAGF